MCLLLRAEASLCGTEIDPERCTLHDALMRCETTAKIDGITQPYALRTLKLARSQWQELKSGQATNPKISRILKPFKIPLSSSWEACDTQLAWLVTRADICPSVAVDKSRISKLELETETLTSKVATLKSDLEASRRSQTEVQQQWRVPVAIVGILLGLVGSGLLGRSFRLSSNTTQLSAALKWTIPGGILAASGLVTTAIVFGDSHSQNIRLLKLDEKSGHTLASVTTAACALSTAAATALWIYAPLTWQRHNDPDNLRNATSGFNAATAFSATSTVCWTVAGGLWRNNKTKGSRDETSGLRRRARLFTTPFPVGVLFSLRF